MYNVGLSTRNKVFGEELFAKYQSGEKYGVKIWTFHLPYSPSAYKKIKYTRQ